MDDHEDTTPLPQQQQSYPSYEQYLQHQRQASQNAATEPPPSATATRTHRHGGRVAIAGIAAALMFGSAGVGYAIGHDGSDTSASSQTQTLPGTSEGNGSQNNSQGDNSQGDGSQDGNSEGIPSMPQLGPGGQSDGSGSGQNSNSTSATNATDEQEKGLVYINTSVDYGEAEAAGTGMILTSDGTILTNHHVVEGATTIEAQVISTGKTYKAKVVGYDSTHDVAVLKLVDASGLTTVNLASTAAAVGDKVTAVGNANGDGGDASAATGSVTALDQTITVTNDDNTQSTLSDLIKLDADVISGDSGGAVYNSDGEVVGMTTAASSGSAEVTGYAVPISQAKQIADQILDGDESGSVSIGGTAFLGVQLSSQSTSSQVAGTTDGSPAAKAGITAGSTITSIGGTKIATANGLSTTVKKYEPGDTVTVTWTDTSGQSHAARITLTSGPVG